MSKTERKFKVVLLGEAGVGKSSIVMRLIKNEHKEQHSTVGASFNRHSVQVDKMTVSFDIWDTAGQERYKSLAKMYYRGANAAIVVYDITSRDSFERAKYWVRQLFLTTQASIVIALAGNKCDRNEDRAVPMEEAIAYAKDDDLIFMETSAVTGTQVPELFYNVAEALAKQVDTANPAAAAEKVSLDAGKKQKKEGKGCC